MIGSKSSKLSQKSCIWCPRKLTLNRALTPYLALLLLMAAGSVIIYLLESRLYRTTDHRTKDEDEYKCIGNHTGFSPVLFYVISLCSTIGFGTLYPCTTATRIISVPLLIVGLTLFLYIVADVGEKTDWVFRRWYNQYKRWQRRRVKKLANANIRKLTNHYETLDYGGASRADRKPSGKTWQQVIEERRADQKNQATSVASSRTSMSGSVTMLNHTSALPSTQETTARIKLITETETDSWRQGDTPSEQSVNIMCSYAPSRADTPLPTPTMELKEIPFIDDYGSDLVSTQESSETLTDTSSSLTDSADFEDEEDLPVAVGVLLTLLCIAMSTVYYAIAEDYNYFEALYFSFLAFFAGDFIAYNFPVALPMFIFIFTGFSMLSMTVNTTLANLKNLIKRVKERAKRDIQTATIDDNGNLECAAPDALIQNLLNEYGAQWLISFIPSQEIQSLHNFATETIETTAVAQVFERRYEAICTAHEALVEEVAAGVAGQNQNLSSQQPDTTARRNAYIGDDVALPPSSPDPESIRRVVSTSSVGCLAEMPGFLCEDDQAVQTMTPDQDLAKLHRKLTTVSSSAQAVFAMKSSTSQTSVFHAVSTSIGTQTPTPQPTPVSARGVQTEPPQQHPATPVVAVSRSTSVIVPPLSLYPSLLVEAGTECRKDLEELEEEEISINSPPSGSEGTILSDPPPSVPRSEPAVLVERGVQTEAALAPRKGPVKRTVGTQYPGKFRK